MHAIYRLYQNKAAVYAPLVESLDYYFFARRYVVCSRVPLMSPLTGSSVYWPALFLRAHGTSSTNLLLYRINLASSRRTSPTAGFFKLIIKSTSLSFSFLILNVACLLQKTFRRSFFPLRLIIRRSFCFSGAGVKTVFMHCSFTNLKTS